MNRKNLILALFLIFAAPVFAQNADMSLIPYRQGDLWGYTTPDKTIIINPEYEEANLFYEGFAVVKKAGKYGYVNKEGKVVIPIKFYSAKPFHFGYFDVSKNTNKGDGSLNAQKQVLFAGASLNASGYEICIDTKGLTMPKCPAIADNSAKDINKPNTVTVVSNYSTIQKSDLFDKIIADYKMPGADDSYYIATRNNKYGVFNKTFEVIVPFEYDTIQKINMGIMPYLIVEKNGLKGMLFGNGSLYMSVESTRLQYIKASNDNNYIIFTKDGKTGIKNSKYQVVVDPVYENIEYDENGGFVLTGNGNLQGFYFFNDKTLLPNYAEVKAMKGGNFVKIKTLPMKGSKTGKWGYISNELVEYFSEE